MQTGESLHMKKRGINYAGSENYFPH